MHVGFIPEALTPPRGQSTMAMHTFESGFTEWGAGVRFALNRPDMVVLAYDASAYTGIVFWAKLGDAGAATAMKVSISDTVSEPRAGSAMSRRERASPIGASITGPTSRASARSGPRS
ncbi:hypothetical protein [Sorangium sp. So ce1078]|uniref:hypothetical protein n=1 Tax=Sorangium sp. So ce1078 TaxID=3133329 RepID=UPI003F627341